MQQLQTYLFNFLYENLIKEGILIILACFVLGWIVKHCLPRIDNNWIVPIVSICGVILALAMPMPGDANKVVTAVKGMILGWASTGGYELFRGAAKIIGPEKLKHIVDLLFKDTTKQ